MKDGHGTARSTLYVQIHQEHFVALWTLRAAVLHYIYTQEPHILAGLELALLSLHSNYRSMTASIDKHVVAFPYQAWGMFDQFIRSTFNSF